MIEEIPPWNYIEIAKKFVPLIHAKSGIAK